MKRIADNSIVTIQRREDGKAEGPIEVATKMSLVNEFIGKLEAAAYGMDIDGSDSTQTWSKVKKGDHVTRFVFNQRRTSDAVWRRLEKKI